ncbi:wax ester/triacylglycerol synthase domain-containing protein [Rhodococcus aetherivorans]
MQLHPSDAQRDWLDDRVRSDQFLLFCFEGPAGDPGRLVAELRRRASAVAELRLHAVAVPGDLDYPYWSTGPVGADRFVVHRLPDPSWPGVQEALGELLTDRLDIRASPWRLHLLPGVTGAPRCAAAATVVVLQVSHAFADGTRASALARTLLSGTAPAGDGAPAGPEAPAVPVMLLRAAARVPLQLGSLLVTGARAGRAERELADPAVPPPAPGCPPSAVNTDPGPRRAVRTIVCPATDLRTVGTVTVGALTAIGSALAEFLGDFPADRLGAEVPVSLAGNGLSRNAYRSTGVRLFAHVRDPRERAAAIADDLAQRRRRITHPAMDLRDRPLAHVPAPLLRFGLARADFGAVPRTVTGTTVVSSVYRGAGDLVLGGAVVRFTAGFPGLSPVMGLTHGVHGIGDVVTLSVTTSPQVLEPGELDRYETVLRAAVAQVARA